MGIRPNLQATLREFEDTIDDLLDDLAAAISEATPERYIEAPLDDDDIRHIGNAIAIADAVVKDDLQERIDAAFEDFSWQLTRALKLLRETAR
jgi:hypothetical protein